MHGQLPVPEATAITEVLVTGEKGGSQAKLLLQATPSPASTTSSSPLFTCGRSIWTSSSCPLMRTLADRGRMVFSFDAIGFILGLGYVMGLRSSMILCAGGVLANFVLVPLIWFIGSHMATVYPGTRFPIAHMTAVADLSQLRALYRRGRHRHGRHLRHLKSLRVVAGSFGIALRAFRAARRGCRAGAHRPRHLPMPAILLGVVWAPSAWPSSSRVSGFLDGACLWAWR
jgi:hypothetical protein